VITLHSSQLIALLEDVADPRADSDLLKTGRSVATTWRLAILIAAHAEISACLVRFHDQEAT
jgi:hypothetical protein